LKALALLSFKAECQEPAVWMICTIRNSSFSDIVLSSFDTTILDIHIIRIDSEVFHSFFLSTSAAGRELKINVSVCVPDDTAWMDIPS
jgi:hypothetical protein